MLTSDSWDLQYWRFLSSLWHIQVWVCDRARLHLNRHPWDGWAHEDKKKTYVLLKKKTTSFHQRESIAFKMSIRHNVRAVTTQPQQLTQNLLLRSIHWFLRDSGRQSSSAHQPKSSGASGMDHGSRHPLPPPEDPQCPGPWLYQQKEETVAGNFRGGSVGGK